MHRKRSGVAMKQSRGVALRARVSAAVTFTAGLAALGTLGACAQEPVRVQNTASGDYGREQVHQAVAAFVAQGRTPAAYAAFARRINELQPTMDKSVAEEAELKLTVLALAPVQALKNVPVGTQATALALTVWPTAFSEPLRATTQLRSVLADEVAVQLSPLPGETTEAYMLRLCGDALNKVCRDSVPEQHAALLAAYATHRFSERARSAVSDCLVCSTDPSWRSAARGWEELETANNTWIKDVEKRGLPSNWPVAGPGGENDEPMPSLELSTLGEVLINEQPVSASQRPAALRALLGKAKELELHARADVPIVRLRELAFELHRAGATAIALVTREPRYPWDRRLYRVALGKGRRVEASSNDTLQVLLRQVDPLGPGLTRLD
jgi:hypothetical protein